MLSIGSGNNSISQYSNTELATHIKRASFFPGNSIFLLSAFLIELEAIRNLKTSASMGTLFNILCVSVCA